MQFAKSQTSEVIVTFKNMITQALSVSIRRAGPGRFVFLPVT